jgi:hypothetical protein
MSHNGRQQTSVTIVGFTVNLLSVDILLTLSVPTFFRKIEKSYFYIFFILFYLHFVFQRKENMFL